MTDGTHDDDRTVAAHPDPGGAPPGRRPQLETDEAAGARNTAPGAPPGSLRPDRPTPGEAPGVGVRAAEDPAPGSSENSRPVTGVAPPAEDPDERKDGMSSGADQ
jgi:hypothetical protein